MIRHANENDIPAIHTLGAHIEEFKVNDETVNFWPEELLYDAVNSNDTLIVVSEEGGSIVGFVVANLNRSLRKALIENIYVRPEHRGQGISDAMLGYLLDQLSTTGCEHVATLIPTDASGAADLYERSGFSKGKTFLWLDRSLSENYKREK